MSKLRVIVAGSRNFSDYAFLKSKLDFLFSETLTSEITIISGTVRGADKLGEKYANESGNKSKGSSDMISRAKNKNLILKVYDFIELEQAAQ